VGVVDHFATMYKKATAARVAIGKLLLLPRVPLVTWEINNDAAEIVIVIDTTQWD